MSQRIKVESERRMDPHPADGWASTTTRHDRECPRCGARILPGETVVASGHGETSPITWICRRHSNIPAERP